MKLQGVFTALLTPFNSDGSVDEKSLRDLVETQIAKGISGLVPVGTTGESPTLTHDEADLPLIIYNIPGRTGKNIENSTMFRLAEHPNIFGVKEASGSINQMMDVIDGTPDDFSVLSGDDGMGLPMIACGGDGIVSVASNLIPDRMEALVKAALDGNMDLARKLHYELAPLFKSMFIDTNPVPVKYAMAKMGAMKEIYRLPLCAMTEENKAIVDSVLMDLDII